MRTFGAELAGSSGVLWRADRRGNGGGAAAAGDGVLGVDPGEHDRVGLRGVSTAGTRCSAPSSTRNNRDVLRTPMELETLPVAFDQLSWQFLDMTASGGRLALMWDTRMASVRFAVAEE